MGIPSLALDTPVVAADLRPFAAGRKTHCAWVGVRLRSRLCLRAFSAARAVTRRCPANPNALGRNLNRSLRALRVVLAVLGHEAIGALIETRPVTGADGGARTTP